MCPHSEQKHCLTLFSKWLTPRSMIPVTETESKSIGFDFYLLNYLCILLILISPISLCKKYHSDLDKSDKSWHWLFSMIVEQ